MSTTTTTRSNTEVCDPSAADSINYVEFYVDRSGHPRRRLRLQGSHYTLGSGEESSVRLDDASLRAVHAILVRQNGQLVVRGCGIAILVNSIRVTEAALHPNDCVQLGAYTLTLIGSGECKSSSQDRADAPATTSPSESDRRSGASWSEVSTRPLDASSWTSSGNDQSPFSQPVQIGDPSTSTSTSASSTQATASASVPADFDGSIIRLSFADGMRLVAGDETIGSDQAVSNGTPPVSLMPAIAQHRSQSTHASLDDSRGIDSSSRHAVEALADKLDSLLSHLSDKDLKASPGSSSSDENPEIQNKVSSLTDRVQVLETAVDKANREAQQYRERHEQALDRIAQLERQLQETIQNHCQRQEAWEREANELREAIEQLTQQLEQAHQLLASEKSQSASLQQQLSQAQSGSQQDGQSHQAALDRIACLESELSEAVDNHKLRQMAWESEARELNETIERLSRQLAQSETSLSEQVQVSDELDARLRSANDQVQHAQSALLASESESQNKQRDDALADELQSAQQRLMALQEEQSSRQEAWQIEREELEYRIANQAAELSRIATGVPAKVYDDDADVASRLARRLERQVEQLYSQQGTETHRASDIEHAHDDESFASLSHLPSHDAPIDASAYDLPSDDSSSYGSSYESPSYESPSYGSSHDDDAHDTSAYGQSPDPSSLDRYAMDANDDPSLSALSIGRDPGSWEPDSQTDAYGLNDDPYSSHTDDLVELNAAKEQAMEGIAAEMIGDLGADQGLPGGLPTDWNADEQDRLMSPSSQNDDDHASPWPTVDDYPAELDASSTQEMGQEREVDDVSGLTTAKLLQQMADSPDYDDSPAYGESTSDNASGTEGLLSGQYAQSQDDYGQAESPEPIGFSSVDSAPPSAPVPPAPSSASPSVSAEPYNEDDDSIEAYMNRLLNRMNGGSGDEPAPESTPRDSAGSTPVGNANLPPMPTEVEEEPKQEMLLESEYLPRSVAPEQSNNMQAMRELANDSARTAIAKSVRSRQRRQGLFKICLTLACICGAGMFAVLTQRQIFPHALAALACVALGFHWGLSGFRTLMGQPQSPPNPGT